MAPHFKPSPQPPLLSSVHAHQNSRPRPSSDPPKPHLQQARPTTTADSAADPLRVTEEKNDIMRAGLLSKTVDHITLLIEDYFQGVRPRTLIVPCPHCSEGDTPPVKMQRSFSEVLELLPAAERVEREAGENEDSGSTSRTASLAVLRNDEEYAHNRVSGGEGGVTCPSCDHVIVM